MFLRAPLKTKLKALTVNSQRNITPITMKLVMRRNSKKYKKLMTSFSMIKKEALMTNLVMPHSNKAQVAQEATHLKEVALEASALMA